MTNKLKLIALLLIAGAAYLVAAPQYAILCRAAPEGNGHQASLLEIVYGWPAAIFTFAGCALVLGGTYAAILAVKEGK